MTNNPNENYKLPIIWETYKHIVSNVLRNCTHEEYAFAYADFHRGELLYSHCTWGDTVTMGAHQVMIYEPEEDPWGVDDWDEYVEETIAEAGHDIPSEVQCGLDMKTVENMIHTLHPQWKEYEQAHMTTDMNRKELNELPRAFSQREDVQELMNLVRGTFPITSEENGEWGGLLAYDVVMTCLFQDRVLGHADIQRRIDTYRNKQSVHSYCTPFMGVGA